MYTELNPFVLRWIFMAVLLAISGLAIVLVAIGRAVRKRSQVQSRKDVANVPALRARGATAH